MDVQAKLQPPGAGLPLLEWAFAKYIFFPRLFKNTSKEQAIAAFAERSEQIMTLARSLSPEQLGQRRLVPRLRGLEDSSRYWSTAMVLEHLVIVGDLMRRAVVELSAGGTDMAKIGTAQVKPDPDADAAGAIEHFAQMSQRFVREATAADIYAYPQAKYAHPWFGPLNAHQWLVFAEPHQYIHLQQIKEIIARLHVQ